MIRDRIVVGISNLHVAFSEKMQFDDKLTLEKASKLGDAVRKQQSHLRETVEARDCRTVDWVRKQPAIKGILQQQF